jgi:dinuclear metal center YbgI/SA1388 family protein
MLIHEIIRLLDSCAPPTLALPGDPIGLNVGDPFADISHVALCLDCTSSVVEQARRLHAGLIVSHHPLVFNPLRRVTTADPVSAIVTALIKSGIACFAAHTNWDAATGGVNDCLAEALQLVSAVPLGTTGLVSLPRIGKLATPLSAVDFVGYTSLAIEAGSTSTLRHNDVARLISTVCVCGGAGAEVLGSAVAAGADCLVTADVHHHEFIEATERCVLLIDAGHEATEAPAMRRLGEILKAELDEITFSFVTNSGTVYPV